MTTTAVTRPLPLLFTESLKEYDLERIVAALAEIHGHQALQEAVVGESLVWR